LHNFSRKISKLRETFMKEVLTPREAAEYLNIHIRTIYRLVKSGEIPGRKVGGSWRFKRTDLEEWLSIKESTSHEERNQLRFAFTKKKG
jgi:excisionase family DNA binding protein